MAFVDVIILLVVVFGLFYGFFKGVFKIFLAIVSFYLAIVLASLYFRVTARAIGKNSKTSPQVLEMLSFLTLVIVCFLILAWAAFYTFRYFKVRGRIENLDKLLGAFLGLILGAFMAGIFVMMLRYLFVTTNAPATLDFPAMRFLQESTGNSVLIRPFSNVVLPLIYTPISPILPDSADLIFRGLQ